jgi:hypothetical protein
MSIRSFRTSSYRDAPQEVGRWKLRVKGKADYHDDPLLDEEREPPPIRGLPTHVHRDPGLCEHEQPGKPACPPARRVRTEPTWEQKIWDTQIDYYIEGWKAYDAGKAFEDAPEPSDRKTTFCPDDPQPQWEAGWLDRQEDVAAQIVRTAALAALRSRRGTA